MEAIEQKQAKFQRGRVRLRELLKLFRIKPIGRNIGLNIPDDLRERLTVQVDIWKAASYRQLMHSCIVLGLEQVEELGKIQKLALEQMDSEPPPPVDQTKEGRKPIEEFVNDIRAENIMEEAQEVLRPDDTGDDDVPITEWDEDVPSR